MEVLVIAVVANAAAGLSPEPLTHVEVTAAMNAAGPRVVSILQGVVGRW
jgi:purine-nucleoside phosphorylase